MRLFLFGFILVLEGCAQLLNGQAQPVQGSLKYKNAYFTTCAGAVEDWGTCNRKAIDTCPRGYTLLEKNLDSYGMKREIHFECKK